MGCIPAGKGKAWTLPWGAEFPSTCSRAKLAYFPHPTLVPLESCLTPSEALNHLPWTCPFPPLKPQVAKQHLLWVLGTGFVWCGDSPMRVLPQSTTENDVWKCTGAQTLFHLGSGGKEHVFFLPG